MGGESKDFGFDFVDVRVAWVFKKVVLDAFEVLLGLVKVYKGEVLLGS